MTKHPFLNLTTWSATQSQAITARGGNVLVSAGAGSGKTSVLVERVVYCILQEPAVDIDQLLIVTFTEAAAAEMRSRIEARLQALYEVARQSSDRPTIRRLERQFARMEQAQISTLHSFCMDVVRRNFLYLGLDPNISLLADDSSTIIRKNLFKTLVEECLTGTLANEFRAMLAHFQAMNPTHLYHLVERLVAFARSQASPERWLEALVLPYAEASRVSFSKLLWTPAFYGWLKNEMETAQHAAQQGYQLATLDGELFGYAERLQELDSQLRALVDFMEDGKDVTLAQLTIQVQQILAAKSPRAKDSPNKQAVVGFRKRALDKLKAVLEVISRGESELQSDIVRLAPSVARFVEFCLTFLHRFQAEKRMLGVLDFQDLEHFALHVLRQSESGERNRMQHQFAEIFVDEYQDTSPVQDALVQHVASSEGNVFVVGDVKQSIYRFRMAEPNLFLEKYQTLLRTHPGQVISLADNYRSRREVVDVVNFLFAQLFHPDLGGVTYDERAWMHAGANYSPLPSQDDVVAVQATPRVELHVIERSGDTASSDVDESFDDALSMNGGNTHEADEKIAGAAGHIDDEPTNEDLTAIEKEAYVVGRRIISLLGGNGRAEEMIWDKEEKRYRSVEYRDIVILMRSVKNRMNVFLDVFGKLRIPAYGATSSGFFNTLEIKWFVALLQVIDNPRRELALAVVLRSPLFGFTDRELAIIRTARGGHFYDALTHVEKWNKLCEEENTIQQRGDIIEKVQSFVKQLRLWRQLGRRTAALDVLRAVLRDTDFLHYVSGMSGGRGRRANIERLLDIAAEFDAKGSLGLYGFVRKLEENLMNELDAGEARTLGETENVVRIMTVHHSKGLEFPIVFVADVGKQFYRGSDETGYPLHRDYGFGPAFYDDDTDRRWRTLPSITLDALEYRDFIAEEARVLYVALTRARERLILVGSGRNLSALADKATAARRVSELAIPSFLLRSAKSWLEWILFAFVRHPVGHTLLALAHSLPPQTCAGDVSLLPLSAQISVWNHPDGQPLRLTGIALEDWTNQLPQDVNTWPEWLTMNSSLRESMWGTNSTHITIVDRPVHSHLIPGKVSATDMRRLWVAREKQPRAHLWHAGSAERLLESPRFVETDVIGQASGAHGGNAFHAIMQVMDVSTPPTERDILFHLNDLCRQSVLTEDIISAVPVADILGWLVSPLAAKLRKAKTIYREQPFFHRIDLPKTDAYADTYVVAQGVIDCLALVEDAWLLVDYKTDEVSADGVQAKASEYAAQIATYLAAVHPLIGTAKVSAFIYFVKPQMSVQMHALKLERVFSEP